MSNQNKIVLVVEDDHTIRKVAGIQLRASDLDVHTASHGQQALEAVSTNDYALILMDIQMPQMDGIEATKRIRRLEEGTTQHVPIVGVSASLENKAPGLAAGMDDFILKPANYGCIAKQWLNVAIPESA